MGDGEIGRSGAEELRAKEATKTSVSGFCSPSPGPPLSPSTFSCNYLRSIITHIR